VTGNDVLRLRLYLSFTQRDMALSSGISQSTISRLESYRGDHIPASWAGLVNRWYVKGPPSFFSIDGSRRRPDYVVPATGPGLRRMMRGWARGSKVKFSTVKSFMASRMKIRMNTLESYMSMKRLPIVARKRLRKMLGDFA
jgi:hypothetical protein